MTSRAARQRQEMLADLRQSLGDIMPHDRRPNAPLRVPFVKEPYPPSLAEVEDARMVRPLPQRGPANPLIREATIIPDNEKPRLGRCKSCKTENSLLRGYCHHCRDEQAIYTQAEWDRQAQSGKAEVEEAMQRKTDLPPALQVVEMPAVEVPDNITGKDDYDFYARKVRLEELRKKYPGKYLRLAECPFGVPEYRWTTPDIIEWGKEWNNVQLMRLDDGWAFNLRYECYGEGPTPRDAYRAADRERRLAAHNVADLLKEMAQHMRGKYRWRERWLKAEQSLTKVEAELRRAERQENHTRELLNETGEKLKALEAQQVDLVMTFDETELDSTRRYLSAYLTLEAPKDPAALLAEIAKPWHERGMAWIHVVRTVKEAGITVGATPMDLSNPKK
jgi:hypothetical protein